MTTDNHMRSEIPPGAMRHVRMEQIGGDLVLTYRRRHWSPGCFLMFWLAGWTVGCVLLLTAVIRERTLFRVLFGIPFWASWVLVAYQLADLMLRVEVLRVGRWGLSYERQVLVRVASRQIALDQVKSVVAGLTLTRSDTRSLNHLVRIETVGNPLEVFSGIDIADQKSVIEVLESRLTDRASRPAADVEEPGEAARPAQAVRPADSRIAVWRRADEIEFTASGRMIWPAVGFATFACLFWNGIVAVFIFQLCRKLDWGLFAFLIPFELIGLCLVGAWVGCISMPLWRHSWTFGRDEIVLGFRLAGLGYRRTRRVAVRDVAWFDVRQKPSKRGEENTLHINWRTGRYLLALLDKQGRELATVAHLTEGEANWMAAEATRFYSRS